MDSIKPSHQWYIRAAIINAMQLVVFIIFNKLWPQNYSLGIFSLPEYLPDFLAAFIAYFIFTFVVYWWHRLRHQSKTIWLIFHQLHHSPQRIETLTAYYIHPLDLIANLFISNTIMFVFLDLTLNAAAWYTLITGAAGFFIHANIKVPRAVGYFFQTPEMHRVHHKTNYHTDNFSDIVLWDWLFGTYNNPYETVKECGFGDQFERKLLPMLIAKDILNQKE